MQTLIHRWLLLIGAGHVLLGLGLTLPGALPLMEPYFQGLYASTGEALPSPAQQALIQTLAQLLGPTVASWGLFYCLLLTLYRRHGERWIKAGLYLGLLLWWGPDCWVSARAGLYSHLYLNTAVALAIGVPLALLRPLAPRAAPPVRG